jgi:hypothetical protein
MRVELSLSKRQAEAILRAELSVGYGVRRPVALQAAEFKLREAIVAALRADEEDGMSDQSNTARLCGARSASAHVPCLIAVGHASPHPREGRPFTVRGALPGATEDSLATSESTPLAAAAGTRPRRADTTP